MELSTIMIPPGTTSFSNFSSDGRFMATSTSGLTTSGDPMVLSEMQTLQEAVPPRISGPYDGSQEISLPSIIEA